jgi:hypothetical protein
MRESASGLYSNQSCARFCYIQEIILVFWHRAEDNNRK